MTVIRKNNSSVPWLVRKAKYGLKVILHDLRYYRLGQILPAKPKTLNLLVNDICNSKCQMCLIWKQKKDNEFTPLELSKILDDSLFSRLNYVGVSGGEPTLRADLPEIFQVLVKKKPKIKSAGIITNAILPEKVIEKVTSCARICRNYGVKFNLMVSLDGVGAIHDQVRGRSGNFDSALNVLRYFRDQTDIILSFGCTITKSNLWYLDDLLDFARKERIYGRFRVAEFINRLYNEKQTEFVRNFTDEEKYHLGLFFAKLEREYETSPLVRRTYRNIRDMLLLDSSRKIRCPYHAEAIALDTRGNLIYCSPKSPILGRTIDSSAYDLYINNIHQRKKILSQDCHNCIHDYHAQATIGEIFRSGKRILQKKKLSTKASLYRMAFSRRLYTIRSFSLSEIDHALIVGWYGTETAGDKAILGEILHSLKSVGVKKITLASLHPYYSQWTIRELGYKDIEIIDTYGPALLPNVETADITIMGGGPLMDIAALGSVVNAFIHAKRHQKYTYIAGCGIGPLTNRENIRAVKNLIRMADWVELRDSYSQKWAEEMTGRTDIINSGDPASKYVIRWKKDNLKAIEPQNVLNCYLRNWSEEYQGNLPDKEFREVKLQFEEQLAVWIRRICSRYSLQPKMIAMHHFSIGGDDRDYNRYFANRYLSEFDPIVDTKPQTLHGVLSSMSQGAFNITMRFHSVLFAYTLGVPFVAIDYTHGGKIKGFLTDHEALDKMIDIRRIANGGGKTFFEELDL